jgi:hypothetical protein
MTEFAFILLTIGLIVMAIGGTIWYIKDGWDYEEIETLIMAFGYLFGGTCVFFIIQYYLGEQIVQAWIMFWSIEIDPTPIFLGMIIVPLGLFVVLKIRKVLKKPICSKCKKKLDRKSKFCPSCGGKV